MLIGYHRGQGSIVLRVKILNSSVSTGAGLTGLLFSSAGLIISTIVDNEATATAYTAAGSTTETITTLGTYAAPTATKCRFKEVDATNHKGIYEVQIADARFAVASGKSVLVSISGATNAAETDVVIPLTDIDPYDAVRAGLASLPNVASGSAGAIPTTGTGANQISVSSGQVILQTGTGTGQLDFTSGVVKANATQWLGGTIPAVNVTGVPLVDLKYTLGTISPATAGSVRADAVTGAVGSVTGAVGSVTGNVGGSVASLTTNNDKTGYALSATGSAALTEGYPADGATGTLPQLLYLMLAFLQEKNVAGTTITTKKLDGATTAATYTLDSAVTPTTITRAT